MADGIAVSVRPRVRAPAAVNCNDFLCRQPSRPPEPIRPPLSSVDLFDGPRNKGCLWRDCFLGVSDDLARKPSLRE